MNDVAQTAAKEGEGGQGEEEEDGGVIYVEQKYCTVCNLEQPLRTKHCRSCHRCVATYDHHCPYLDTCVAEKNHHLFFWYLVFQQGQLAFGLYYVSILVVFAKPRVMSQLDSGLAWKRYRHDALSTADPSASRSDRLHAHGRIACRFSFVPCNEQPYDV